MGAWKAVGSGVPPMYEGSQIESPGPVQSWFMPPSYPSPPQAQSMGRIRAAFELPSLMQTPR